MSEAQLLPRGGCSENGINPKAVYNFVRKAEAWNLGIDSFMVIEKGVVVAEGYHSPYTNLTPHDLFSMSKTLTATAIGFAVAEGKLSLEDSICKFFPEYRRSIFNRANRKITIRHLITMTSGKRISVATARHNKNWLAIFFNTMPLAKPGKKFYYVSDNYYVLSAIISRVYGETVADFLYPRLFEPLGIEKPFWEQDNSGYSSGGWGLYMPIEALAKIMICYSRHGVWEGRQVLPREWVDEATKYHVDTVKKGQPDVTKGYGYGFWRTVMPNAYRAYGLYGQFGYVFEDRDTVIVVNSGIAPDAQLAAAITEMCGTLWDTPDESYEEKLKEMLANLGDKDNLPAGPRNTELEESLSGLPMFTRTTSFASMTALAMSAMFNEKVGNLNLFKFTVKEDGELYLCWREGRYTNEIRLGMNNEYAISDIHYDSICLNACAKAAWINDTTLRLFLRIRESCLTRQLDFDFAKRKRVSVHNVSIPDLPRLLLYYIDFLGFVLPAGMKSFIANRVAPAIMLLAEPNFRLRK